MVEFLCLSTYLEIQILLVGKIAKRTWKTLLQVTDEVRVWIEICKRGNNLITHVVHLLLLLDQTASLV